PVHKAEVLQTSPEDLPIIEGNRPRVGGSQSKPPPQLKPLSSLSPPAEPPKVMVYPEQEVELGEPNVLICMADNFSPPVLNMTWLKNGHLVTEGVQTMDYYPKKNHAFRRFSYLTFVPNQDDNYICEVDHWGLKEPLGKLWNANIPEPLPETTENVVCALGLAIGIVGIVVGTFLMIKSRKMGEASYRRGHL
ncbi:HLA class II histocompatibility antigen, DR alpha chain-like, partial [Protobothrops mucrosquamatus]|uniref:HLA class II histocompatibility antigen, DR alpha chain-like n=1 Tax=Protobothrops mucrosquamatus TaxID=103944 RepID=UPI00077570A9